MVSSAFIREKQIRQTHSRWFLWWHRRVTSFKSHNSNAESTTEMLKPQHKCKIRQLNFKSYYSTGRKKMAVLIMEVAAGLFLLKNPQNAPTPHRSLAYIPKCKEAFVSSWLLHCGEPFKELSMHHVTCRWPQGASVWGLKVQIMSCRGRVIRADQRISQPTNLFPTWSNCCLLPEKCLKWIGQVNAQQTDVLPSERSSESDCRIFT